MMWADLIAKRQLSKDEIANGVSKAFKVSLETILVVSKVADELMDESIRILCHAKAAKGEFSTMISIYLKNNLQTTESQQVLIARLAEVWQTEILFSDESMNPYSMYLMSKTGDFKRIALDVERADQGEFVIASELKA